MKATTKPTIQEQAVQSMKDALDPTIHHLTSAITAKQGALADLSDQVEKAMVESRRKIEETRQATEARQAELVALLEPLESKRDMISQIDATLAAKRREFQEETGKLKEERGKALMAIRIQADREQMRLNAIQDAIAACKEKVAKV